MLQRTGLDLCLLALVDDKLVELLLFLGGQILQALGGIGADVEIVHG